MPQQTELKSAGPVKISLSGLNVSPTKGGWKTIQSAETRPPAVRQFFDDSAPSSPAFRSPPRSSRSLQRQPSPEPERPPLQQPHVYLDLIDENERKYSDHLRTVAPYMKAAFDQWFAQDTTPALPAFLDHYFGRRPTLMEVTQIETLLGLKTKFSRDQEELKLLHDQAIDLRNAQHPNRPEEEHWSPGREPRRRHPRVRDKEDERMVSTKISPRKTLLSESERISATRAPESDAYRPRDASPSLTEKTHGSGSGRVSAAIKPQAIVSAKKTNASGEVYERLAHVGEGTYGKVYKAKHVETGAFYALKRIRMEGEKDGFPVTAMREVKLLQNLRHPNVLRLVEMMVSKGESPTAYGSELISGSVYMVLEYMDHDLTGVLAQPNLKFSPANLKSLNYQMLSGLAYLHEQGILHRDMKGSNILLNAAGELKLADFGLARIYSKRQRNDYTNRVITLWYRGPELLLGETVYGPEVDMWSAG
jgi:hypothetical protein